MRTKYIDSVGEQATVLDIFDWNDLHESNMPQTMRIPKLVVLFTSFN
jgi:hypothetical protein